MWMDEWIDWTPHDYYGAFNRIHPFIQLFHRPYTHQLGGHASGGGGRHVQGQLVGNGDERLPLIERLYCLPYTVSCA